MTQIVGKKDIADLFVVTLRKHCQTSNISGTLIGNKIVNHSDVVGASPVGTALTTSPFLPFSIELDGRPRRRHPLTHHLKC